MSNPQLLTLLHPVYGQCAMCKRAATMPYAIRSYIGNVYVPWIDFNVCSQPCADGFILRLKRVKAQAER